MPHVTYLCRYSSQYCPEQCSSPTTPGVPALSLSLSLSLSLRCACQTLTPRGGVGPGATTRPTVVRARPHHRLSDHLPTFRSFPAHASLPRGSPTPAGDAHPHQPAQVEAVRVGEVEIGDDTMISPFDIDMGDGEVISASANDGINITRQGSGGEKYPILAFLGQKSYPRFQGCQKYL